MDVHFSFLSERNLSALSKEKTMAADEAHCSMFVGNADPWIHRSRGASGI
jgi:hypothetical protein